MYKRAFRCVGARPPGAPGPPPAPWAAAALISLSQLQTVSCPFCSVAPDRVLIDSSTAVAFSDTFPVSTGHALIVPREHVCSLFDLSSADRIAVWELVTCVRQLLIQRYAHQAGNIGINDASRRGLRYGVKSAQVRPIGYR